MSCEAIRKEYSEKGLHKMDLAKNPFSEFKIWYYLACDQGLREPNAMVLSTIGEEGYPQSRTVLLKEWDYNGFYFFTNYKSSKGREIEKSGKGSLLFLWLEMERQIRITGDIEKATREKSEEYFQLRPRGSQLSAWASSEQSGVLRSREQLEQQYKLMEEKFQHEDPVPLPPFWGGYQLKPVQFEFWQGRANRLHDRFRYTKESSGNWEIERLYP